MPQWAQANTKKFKPKLNEALAQEEQGLPPPGIQSRDRDMETSLGQQRESVSCFLALKRKSQGGMFSGFL